MQEEAEKELALREIYYEKSNTRYRSPQHLWELAREQIPDISKHFVKEWLLGQSAYTRFKKWNHPKHFRHTIVRDFDQLQMDLVILDKYEDENRGYRDILVVIEILSRYAFVVPLKSKYGYEVKEGIEKVLDKFLDRFHKYPKYIQFDEGKEFLNKDVKSLLDDKDIEYFYTYSPRKASVVERLNRTLKTKMMRMFEYEGNHTWVDDLQKLVDSYNDSVHRSIGMKPKDVSEEDKFRIWGRLFGKLMTIRKPKYKVDEMVRVLKLNVRYRVAQLESRYYITKANKKDKVESEKLIGDKFKERYKDHDPEKVANPTQHAVNVKRPPFSREIFRIDSVLLGDPVVYKLYSDEFDREIKGIFYEEELSLERK